MLPARWPLTTLSATFAAQAALEGATIRSMGLTSTGRRACRCP